MKHLFAILFLVIPLQAAEKIIVDTDCGYFGDDGITLVMLLRSPAHVQVEAITIVSGNVWSETSLGHTREILKLLNQQRVPLYIGAEMPLKHTPAMAEEEHKKWGPLEFRGAFSDPMPVMSEEARRVSGVVELIRRIKASNGNVTLVALGPMTNIAIVLQREPELAAKIRRLVFMGGQFRVPGNASKAAEFNFWFDPEAAQVVLRSSIKEKVMFGLDVTNKAMLDKQGFDEIVQAGTPVTERFREDFGIRYPGFIKNPTVTVSLWDALVAAWLIDPSMFGKPEMLYLDVETKFGPTYGKVTRLNRSVSPAATPVSMINDLNYREVYRLFRDLLKGK